MQKMKEQDEMYEEKLSEYGSVKSALVDLKTQPNARG